MLKKNSVKYVLNTYVNSLYIISLYSFLIALYIKDVKPVSSASVVQKSTAKIKKMRQNAMIWTLMYIRMFL